MTLNRRLAITLGFTALLGAAVVQAEEVQEAHVPFAFEMAGQQVEAGTYRTVRQDKGIVVVRNSETQQAVFLIPMLTGLTNKPESTLTFRHYGSHYFLHKVQFGRYGTIYQVETSKREKELAKAERPQITLIAMR